MGNYNPRAPFILGEEWVPIRNEVIQFSPAVNAFEVGHGFTLAVARQVGDGRFYVAAPPQTDSESQMIGMAVYARGTSDQTGPINTVVIPVSSALVSGTGWSLSGAATAVEALWNPSDGKRLLWTTPNSGSSEKVLLGFPINQYAQLLNGKRILGLNILYNGARTTVSGDPQTPIVFINRFNAGVGSSFDNLQLDEDPFSAFHTLPIQRMELGEMTQFWTTSTTSHERLPWTFTSLKQFDWSNLSPAPIELELTGVVIPNNVLSMSLDYLALEVVYCEEQRLMFAGSRYFSDSSTAGSLVAVLTQGVNILTMRDLLYAANPVLAAGDYDVVVWSPNPGDLEQGETKSTFYSEQNALRQLYQIPPHPGVEVTVPFPVFDNVGNTFTEAPTSVLPQLSLHATGGGPLTEPHVYGRQGAAQVWGSNTATQEIVDDVVGVNTVYQQVRFYARRFGDTTIPLALTGTGSLAGSSVTITVSDFDTLTEIVDGWKEVTLRFNTPPTMGTLASPEPSWAWSASGETKGNRWEILAACAPAVSGIPGNMLNLAPSGQQLGTATYQPPAGATAELTWMPQGVASPWVSGASADQGCDAVLIFSQDPPTVTGFAITSLTQTVTGIGINCGSLPCCVPTGISYQRVTWSPTSLPATGFGAYELQRFDTTPGATFQTIMLASSRAVTGFNDFEARVGVNSVYRVRALNILNFAGAWSAQVTGAPPTPGVTGGQCPDGTGATGALIFTTNAAQSGALNAAYVMQWERDIAEDFQFPEAGSVQFQPMYQRDGMVAFHGTERGLEQFARTLLIQAGAIDPIRLADTKTLRDLAWASVPYVCVRDELGDRWFANVRVPTVSVRNQRKAYLAQVQIAELTQTPYAVDPS